MQTIQIPKEYYDQIIAKFNLGDKSEEEREQVFTKLNELLFKNIMLRVVEELNDNDADKLNDLMGGGGFNNPQVFDFMEEKLPNLDELVADEINNFRMNIGL